MTTQECIVSAKLTDPLAKGVDRLMARGYTPSEIVRRGIRLVLAEEGIAVQESA